MAKFFQIFSNQKPKRMDQRFSPGDKSSRTGNLIHHLGSEIQDYPSQTYLEIEIQASRFRDFLLLGFRLISMGL